MVNLQQKIESLENRISELEEDVKFLKNSKEYQANSFDNLKSIREIPKNIIQNIEKIPTKDLVLILLRITPNQSINDLELNLKKIGWVEDTFFKKNFGTSLIKTSLIHPSEKNVDGKNAFLLTAKGEIIADKILEDLSSKFK